ncbi:MAG: hypothetical protein AAF573_00580 [Bacteroidota bacterium]
MTTSKFNDLKQLLITGKNLSQIFDFFFKNFGGHEAFHGLGEVSSNEILSIALQAAGESLYGGKCKMTNTHLTEISDQNFMHGTCFLNSSLTLVIFFTDLNLGLASISMGGSRFNFVRLKASMLPNGHGVQFSEDGENVVN